MAEDVFKATPADFAEALKGVDFPLNKDQIVDYAAKHGTREKVMEIFKKFPEAEYHNMADVFQGYGIAVHGKPQ